MLKLYIADISALPTSAEDLSLSEDRMRKLEHMKPLLKRRQTIGAELLLIHALRQHGQAPELPLPIERDSMGKPFLPESEFQFSLAHAGRFAACALSDRPVGLDVEGISPCRRELLRRCCTPDELRWIQCAADCDARFTQVWTRKESCLKAKGSGLRVPLNSFSVMSPPDDVRFWSMRFWAYSFSLCVLTGNPDPDEIRLIELP